MADASPYDPRLSTVTRASSWSSATSLLNYNASGVIPINTVLLNIDTAGSESLGIQVTSLGTTGVITPEWSNDNTTWVGATLLTPANSSTTTITAAGVFVTTSLCRYLRLRLSTATTAGATSISVARFNSNRSAPTVALPAGSNTIGDVGVQYRASNTGAASFVSVLSPATPAAATIKASTGRMIGYYLQNSATGLRSVKVFNATAPTLGTTAASFEIDIPAGGSATFRNEGGIGFSTAMTYSVTSAKGLNDNTATGLAANDVSGYFLYA